MLVSCSPTVYPYTFVCGCRINNVATEKVALNATKSEPLSIDYAYFMIFVAHNTVSSFTLHRIIAKLPIESSNVIARLFSTTTNKTT